MVEYDIKKWDIIPQKHWEYILNNGEKVKTTHITNLTFSCVHIYALFKMAGISEPNGIYTFFGKRKPLDCPIWWDFFVEKDNNFIHVVRTNKQLEVTYFHFNEEFNIYNFFSNNLSKYKKEIEQIITQKFEKHIVYHNHYKSYLNSIITLNKEIAVINLTEPNPIQGHIATKEALNTYQKGLEIYTNNLILFHPKAKALLLNTAFMVESFINLIIRISAKKELLFLYPNILKKYLNYNFRDKLKGLKFYTRLFEKEVSFEEKCVKIIFELMTTRNKYVHFDEGSKINISGEEYFDNDFPLFNVNEKTFQIDLLNKTYLKPSKSEIDIYYENAFLFKNYILSLIKKQYVSDIEKLLNENPISFNIQKKVYSSIYPNALMEFYIPLKE